jgi:hypothetical protein
MINEGIDRFTHEGVISKKEVWNFYLDAKKLEEILENMIVPPKVLQVHISVRESVRCYRRAVGSFHGGDNEAFSREMANATNQTILAARYMNDLVATLEIPK